MGALRQDWWLFHRSQCYLLDLLCRYFSNAVYENCKTLRQYSISWAQCSNLKSKQEETQTLPGEVLQADVSLTVPQPGTKPCSSSGTANIQTSWVPRAASLVRQVSSQRQDLSSRTSEAKPACWQPERLGSGQTWQAYPKTAMWHINQSCPQERLQQSRNANFHCKKCKKKNCTSLF